MGRQFLLYNGKVMKRFRLLSSWACSFRAKTVDLAASRRGAAAVEFAILMPIIFAGLVGIANYGLVVEEKMELVSAARAGGQQALYDRTDTTAIKDVVVASTELDITTADVAVTESCWCADTAAAQTCGVTCDNGADGQYFMDITVSEVYTLLLLGTTLNLSGSVRIRTK